VSVLDWILSPASVSRQVNYLYFLIVFFLTVLVLGTALYTKNRRGVRLFLLAMVVWSGIEFIGLATGMRVYKPESDKIVIFIFVALVEDPGWVCLCYLIAERLFKVLWKAHPPHRTERN